MTAESPVLFEGDEEVQYVYVSLPTDLDPVAFGPGATVTIEGLATEHPVLRPAVTGQPGSGGTNSSAPPPAADPPPGASSSNSTLGSAFGSSSSSSAAALQGQYVDSLGSVLLVKEQQIGAPAQNAKPAFSYVGHTDKQLQFTKPS